MATKNYNLPYPSLNDVADVPSDIQALAEAVDENLKTEIDKQNAKNTSQDKDIQSLYNISPKVKLQGTSFHIPDSAEAPMKISPRGNDIEQDTREGYNKVSFANGSETLNGMTCTRNNGKIILNGTATSNAKFFIPLLNKFTVSANKYVTFQAFNPIVFAGEANLRLRVVDANFNEAGLLNITNINSSDFVLLNTSADFEVAYLLIRVETGITLSNFELTPQIVLGTEAKPYEQYGATPSLAFPSPVKHVGGKVKSYNLYNIGDVEETTVKGVTYSIKNGRFKANGTSTGEISIKTNSVLFNLLSGDYTFGTKVISGTYSGIVGKYVYNGSGENIIDGGLINSTVNRTLTGNATDLYAQIYIANGVVFNNYEADIMLVKGTYTTETLPPFVPYGEVGSVYDIAKVNKNLAKFLLANNHLNNVATPVLNENVLNYIKVVATEGTDHNSSCMFRMLDLTKYAGKTITISARVKSSGSNKAFIVVRQNGYEYISANKTNEKFDETQNTANGIISFPYTVASQITDTNRYLYMGVYARRGSTGNAGDYIEYWVQIEDSETQTEIVNHQQENHFLDLTNLPLYSKNDYIYKSGDKWFVHNEFDRYDFTGLEVWKKHETTKNNAFYIEPSFNPIKDKMVIPTTATVVLEIYSNILKSKDLQTTVFTDTEGIAFSNTGDIYIGLSKNGISTVESLKTYLQNNSIYMIYPLANPTETEITDKKVIAVLEELYNTYAYDEVTNISVENPILSAELVLDVLYYQKTALGLETKVSYEEYAKLQKRVEELENVILTLGGTV